jgi:hypothetical protein
VAARQLDRQLELVETDRAFTIPEFAHISDNQSKLLTALGLVPCLPVSFLTVATAVRRQIAASAHLEDPHQEQASPGCVACSIPAVMTCHDFFLHFIIKSFQPQEPANVTKIDKSRKIHLQIRQTESNATNYIFSDNNRQKTSKSKHAT